MGGRGGVWGVEVGWGQISKQVNGPDAQRRGQGGRDQRGWENLLPKGKGEVGPDIQRGDAKTEDGGGGGVRGDGGIGTRYPNWWADDMPKGGGSRYSRSPLWVGGPDAQRGGRGPGADKQ